MNKIQHLSNNGVLGAPAGWGQGEAPCNALPITGTHVGDLERPRFLTSTACNSMNPLHYRDMIIRAAQAGDMRRIDQLAAQLAMAEEARRLLQALTHCPACAVTAVAGLVAVSATVRHE